jgi:hypothetical protein
MTPEEREAVILGHAFAVNEHLNTDKSDALFDTLQTPAHQETLVNLYGRDAASDLTAHAQNEQQFRKTETAAADVQRTKPQKEGGIGGAISSVGKIVPSLVQPQQTSSGTRNALGDILTMDANAAANQLRARSSALEDIMAGRQKLQQQMIPITRAVTAGATQLALQPTIRRSIPEEPTRLVLLPHGVVQRMTLREIEQRKAAQR